MAALFTNPKAPKNVPIPERDDAIAATMVDDQLRRRRGSAANILLGAAGGEAMGTSVKALTGE